MPATAQVVGDDRVGPAGVANNLEIPLIDLSPVDEAGVVGGPGSTPTPGLDLQFESAIGDFHETFAPWEHQTLERGEQSEGIDVDVELVHHPSELVDLARFVELGLVADDGMQALAIQVNLIDQPAEVDRAIDDDGLGRHAETAGYHPLMAIELGDQQASQATPGQVVVNLQRLGRLPRPHGSVEEAELCHRLCTIAMYTMAGSPRLLQWSVDDEYTNSPTVTVPSTTPERLDAHRSPLPRRGLRAWFGRPVFLEARSPFELKALRRHSLWWGQGIPHGRDRPILVIPGFLARSTSADSLVRILELAGWRARIADVGRNSGPAYAGVESSEHDLHRLFDDAGEPVIVVGHSRGGQFARILAVRYPEMIRQIITLGSPLVLKYPRFAPVRVPIEALEMTWRRGAFGSVNPQREDEVDRDRFVDFPSTVDFVSIYSRTDGFIDWRASLDPAATLMEVSASHLGLINSVAGVQAITDALDRHSSHRADH